MINIKYACLVSVSVFALFNSCYGPVKSRRAENPSVPLQRESIPVESTPQSYYSMTPVNIIRIDSILKFEPPIPTPFGPDYRFSVSLPCTSFVKIVVLDIGKNRLDSTKWENLPAGQYKFLPYVQSLKSGKYLFELSACDKTVTCQYLLLR